MSKTHFLIIYSITILEFIGEKMKKTLFIVSHLGSDSNKFCETLNQHPKIDIKNFFLTYSTSESLLDLHLQKHKLDNTSAIYGDQIVFNKDFSSDSLYSLCKFIYFVREPFASLSFLIKEANYTELSAYRYYSYRLRRIYEMCKRTPEAILITWQNFKDKKGLNLIQNYLNLKENINYLDLEEYENILSPETMKLSYDCYEKYLYSFKQIPNLKLIN